MRHVKWVVVLLGFVAVALGVGAVQGAAAQRRVQDRGAGAADRQSRRRGQAPSRGLRDHARPHQRALRRRDGQEAGLRDRGRRRSHRRRLRGHAARHARRREDRHRHVLLHALRGGQRGGVAAERHLLGDVLRRSAAHPARAQERVPDRDRRHRVRLVQRRVHRQAPGAPPRQEAERAARRVPLRGFLVRPERDRDGAPARQAGVRHAGGGGRVLHVHHQRPDAGHPQAQGRQPRHPAPHRAQPGRHPLLAAGARAELPVQGGRARRRDRVRLARLRQGVRQRRQRALRAARARPGLRSSRRCGPRASGSSARSARP